MIAFIYRAIIGRALKVLGVLLVFTQTCTGQKDSIQFRKAESLRFFPKTVIKDELTFFCLSRDSITKSLNFSKLKLNEIPLKKCSGDYMFFSEFRNFPHELV